MSLKSFHIAFIALSSLMAFAFGAWLIDGFTKSQGAELLVAGLASIGAGGFLIAYGIRFLRKLKHVSFL